MLLVRSEFLAAAKSASKVEDLWPLAQAAIELEHATIPPYLTAMLSLKQGVNDAARAIIASVMRQEMLHMSIAANLLNAIGGEPEIDRPSFVPSYPGQLPMLVDDGLTVGLRKASRSLLYEVFMRIEEPENALNLPVKPSMMRALAAPAQTKGYPTIGSFYAAIKAALQRIGPSAFAHPSHPQVVDSSWFAIDELFPITDLDSALRAIEIIVQQGEGTKSSPFERGPNSAPAHYYRFAEIVNGRCIAPDPKEKLGYSYSGSEISLDPDGVWDLYPDPKAADYAKGSRARLLVAQFNYSYTAVLRALHQAFNGAPDRLKAALGAMYELRLLGGEVVATAVGKTGLTATPSFEYTTELL